MGDDTFLMVLNGIDFPRLYWEFCDRFPVRPTGKANLGRKEDIETAFKEAGAAFRFDSRDRSFTVEEEEIGGTKWYGVFVKKTHGIDLMFGGEPLARLAYDAKRLADPTFERSQFHGPPPYPRPAHNGDELALKEIIRSYVALLRLIKDALRSKASA